MITAMIHLHNPLPDLTATEQLAQQLAPLMREGDLLALQGNLGAGKTAFARALLQALGIKGEIPSPTFTLVQSYDTPNFTLNHFDLYRLKSENELDELGWDDACASGVTIVEWPERCIGRLPQDYLLLKFSVDDQGNRVCILHPYGSWSQRLKDMHV